jgi:hypothetical protein
MNIWERFISIKVIFRTLTYLPMMNVSFIIKLLEKCSRFFLCSNILWTWSSVVSV